jgi:hypothetical protein
MAETLDELVVKIKADASNLEKEMAQVKRKVSQDSKELDYKLNFKTRLDNSLAKLKITELQSYRDKLQARFNQQLKTNVDAGSINRTKTLISGVNTQLEGLGKTGMSTGAKIVAGFVALGGIRGAFRFVSESIKLFFEQAKAVAGVEQAVRRTGGAAGFTAIQLKAIASELQNITGIGDEEILKGVTKQLLTFTLITGTSFKRAQEAVLDLNAVIAGGEIGGLTSQAIQLGKALENPIAGVGALSRAGVTFTEEQKKMIAGFVKQNDLMSAQDIILKEIENKYGGQAKALAGALGGTKQYAAAVGDLKEAIGGLIASIPGLNFLIVNLTGGMKTITQWFQGAAYEAEQLRLELDNLKSAASQIQVKGLGVGDLTARKKANDEIIKQNEIEGNQLKEQIKDAKSKIRFSDDEVDALERKLLTVAQSTQIARGENETYAKQIGIIENINKSWEKSGKTLGQVQDRITFLEEQKIDLEVKGIDAKKVQKEIDDLNKYIDTSKPSGSGSADYIKGLEKTLDNYRDKIRLLNDELSKLGDGSSEKKLILTLELEKVQKQLNDAEITIGLKVGELDFDAGNLDTSKISDEITKDSEKMALATAESSMKQKEAINNYYDQIGVKSEEYFQNKIQRIKEESDAILASTENEFLAKEFQIVRLQELEQEYFDWKLEEWRKQNKVADAAFNALESGMTEALQLIKIRTRENVSAVEQAFVDMANTFIAQVERMIAEWLTFQLLKGIVGIIGAPFTGGASLALAAHKGGEFLGTSSGIRKMASGGSFIVPNGFPNDSYPMLVESGERVSVTPAGSVGAQDRLLSEISNRLKTLEVLNKNLISKNFSPVINNSLEIDGRKLAKQIHRTTNKMQEEGQKF